MTIGCRTTCIRKNMVGAGAAAPPTGPGRSRFCLQLHRCCGGFFGEHCEPCPGPSGQPCYGNGVCVDGTNGTGVCQCHKGFNGTACETCEGGKYGVHCDQGRFCMCPPGTQEVLPLILPLWGQTAAVRAAAVTRVSPAMERASVTSAGEESSATKVRLRKSRAARISGVASTLAATEVTGRGR